jgi:hypothetical protein
MQYVDVNASLKDDDWVVQWGKEKRNIKNLKLGGNWMRETKILKIDISTKWIDEYFKLGMRVFSIISSQCQTLWHKNVGLFLKPKIWQSFERFLASWHKVSCWEMSVTRFSMLKKKSK